jgi:hypothetical protein
LESIEENRARVLCRQPLDNRKRSKINKRSSELTRDHCSRVTGNSGRNEKAALSRGLFPDQLRKVD